MPKYVDNSRSDDNSVVIPAPSESYVKKRCNELRDLQPHERAAKHTAAISTSGIITFSHEAQPIIMALSVEEQDAMYRDVAERIAARLDTDLISLSVHRDESAPHAHFSMIAVNKEGIPISKAVHVSGMRELQDIAGRVMAERGLPITRGKPKQQRIDDGEPEWRWMYRNVKQLYEDIPKEIDEILERKWAIEKEAEEAVKKRDRNMQLVTKSQEKLDAGNGDVDKLEKRITTYNNRIAAQESTLETLQREVSAIDKALAEKRKRVEATRNTMPAPSGFRIPMLDVAVLTNPDSYADAVAEYAAEQARIATAAERESLTAREVSLVKRLGAVERKEVSMKVREDSLNERESKLDQRDANTVESRSKLQTLQARFINMTSKIGKLMGADRKLLTDDIEKHVLNSKSLDELRSNVQAKGHGIYKTPGIQ